MKHVRGTTKRGNTFPRTADMADYKTCLKEDWYGNPRDCKTEK